MSKQSGRRSTRLSIPINRAEVHSCAFDHEFEMLRIEGRECSIQGCTNRLYYGNGDPVGKIVVYVRRKPGYMAAGWACGNCTRHITGDISVARPGPAG